MLSCFLFVVNELLAQRKTEKHISLARFQAVKFRCNLKERGMHASFWKNTLITYCMVII